MALIRPSGQARRTHAVYSSTGEFTTEGSQFKLDLLQQKEAILKEQLSLDGPVQDRDSRVSRENVSSRNRTEAGSAALLDATRIRPRVLSEEEVVVVVAIIFGLIARGREVVAVAPRHLAVNVADEPAQLVNQPGPARNPLQLRLQPPPVFVLALPPCLRAVRRSDARMHRAARKRQRAYGATTATWPF
jgi:hypothetical protein